MTDVDPNQTQTVFGPVHQDRRRWPRVTLRLPGKVVLEDGRLVDVVVHDLSQDGLQIRCDKKSAFLIYPSGRSVKEGPDAPEIRVLFHVPLDSGPGRVRARGALMYFQLIAPDVAAFGMRFRSVSKSGVQHLRAVVQAALQPD